MFICTSWRQSELDVEKDYPDYERQVSFKNGQRVAYGEKGSVRTDLYKTGSSIEVKNYSLGTESGRNNLIQIVSKQYSQRLKHLPLNTHQIVYIDIRGQSISQDTLNMIKQELETTCNGIEVVFKR